jgi:hypothetical protein
VIEGGPNFDLNAADLHARAMEYADKADGRIPLEPGDSIDFRRLYQTASGFEQAVFYLIPSADMEKKSQAAVTAVAMAFTGRDYVGAIGFGREALEDLGEGVTPVAKSKISRFIEKSVDKIIKSSLKG